MIEYLYEGPVQGFWELPSSSGSRREAGGSYASGGKRRASPHAVASMVFTPVFGESEP